MTYEPRMADVGWSHGSLVSPPPVATPESSREDREAVLAAAAEIVDGIAAITTDSLYDFVQIFTRSPL